MPALLHGKGMGQDDGLPWAEKPNGFLYPLSCTSSRLDGAISLAGRSLSQKHILTDGHFLELLYPFPRQYRSIVHRIGANSGPWLPWASARPQKLSLRSSLLAAAERAAPHQFMLSRAVLQRLRPVLSPAKYLQRKRALLYSTVTTQANAMDAVNTSHKVIIVGGGPAGT